MARRRRFTRSISAICLRHKEPSFRVRSPWQADASKNGVPAIVNLGLANLVEEHDKHDFDAEG
jgi:hypothetical protein